MQNKLWFVVADQSRVLIFQEREAGVLDAIHTFDHPEARQHVSDLMTGSRGRLYGAASNDPFAAFRRPPNRLDKLPGLYLASGSAHPGGGMPLAIQSGAAAAAVIFRDHPTAMDVSP